jgi:protoporphyrinogen oxidase
MSVDGGGLLIIGAGPTGLALSMAWAGPSRILEAGDAVGGLCRSVTFGGGQFDLGGHSFHAADPVVAARVEGLMAGRWHSQRRDARVHFGGRLIDYPFQAHVDQIGDAAIVAECEAGRPSLTADSSTEAADLESWIVARFGQGIARHFMLPYNRKLWARDLKRISPGWVGERVAGGAPPAGPGRRPLTPQSVVAYPAEGGFAAIFEAMAARCGPIAFGQRVSRIDPTAGMVWTSAGQAWPWERLVSTMPLPELLRAIVGCPPALIAAADRLEAVSLKILMILTDGAVGAAPQRVYVASPDMPAHKIAFNHTSSPSLRARPVSAIMGEIAYSPKKPAPSDADLTNASLDWLVDAGLIAGREPVIETRIVDLSHGYPVQTHDRPAILTAIRAYLTPLGIHTAGRFGGWDYVNSDACIGQGLRLADELSAAAPGERARRA